MTARFRHFFLMLLPGLFAACASTNAIGCSKDYWRGELLPGSSSGFVHGTSGAPVRLPSNARGMLYRAEGIPVPADFTLSDLTSGASLAVRITPIKALALATRLPLTLEVDQKETPLYRIEPRDGFQPGGRYRLKRNAGFESVVVQIDTAAFDPQRHGITLRQDGPVNREATLIGLCSDSFIQVAAWNATFDVPAPGQPYRALLLGLTVNQKASAVATPESPDLQPSPYHDIHFKRQRDLFGLDRGTYRVVDQAPETRSAAVLEEQESIMRGLVGMLEVADALYPTPALAVRLSGAGVRTDDSLDYLRDAQRRRAPEQLAALLSRVPVRHTDVILPRPGHAVWTTHVEQEATHLQRLHAGQRRMALVNALIRLLQDRNPVLRREAALALARTIGALNLAPRTGSTAAEALLGAMRDPDPGVRRDAAFSLSQLLNHMRGQKQFCGSRATARWTGNCFDIGKLAPLVAANACADELSSCKVPPYTGPARDRRQTARP